MNDKHELNSDQFDEWIVQTSDLNEDESGSKKKKEILSSLDSELNYLNFDFFPQLDIALDENEEKKLKKKSKKNIPQSSKNILESWLKKHHDHPYPSKEKKAKFSRELNLPIKTVNNWFMNSRTRKCNKIKKNQFAIFWIPISIKDLCLSLST